MNLWERSTAVLAALLILGAANTLPGRAQNTAGLTGIIYDSTSMGPLAGARVGVIGTSSATESGQDGRFTLDSIIACLLYTSPSPRD